MPVEHDGAQSEPPPQTPALFAGGVARGEREIIERLGAMTGGPPPLRVLDFQSKDCTGPRRAGDLHSIQRTDRRELDRRRGRTSKLGRDFQFNDAIRTVALDNLGVGEAIRPPPFETKVAPNSGGHEARRPVPAKLTRLFAQTHCIAHRIAKFAGRSKLRALGSHKLRRTSEQHAQFVATLAQLGPNRPAIADKHILGPSDDFPVQRHGRESIKTICDEFVGVRLQVGGGELERGPILPIAFRDPLHGAFIRTEEGVRNFSRCEEIGVHTSGDRGRQPRAG